MTKMLLALAICGCQVVFGASHQRVLVFSPHPDDESLGVGGFIQGAVSQRAEVIVVLMTNGDGYKEAVTKLLYPRRPSARDYLSYGEKRAGEFMRATRQLGLAFHQLDLLGFPDAGLQYVWRDNLTRENPFTSPFTRADEVPYSLSPVKFLKYDRQDLEDEIEKFIFEFRPDAVILPDPRDFHFDHCTTGVLVLAALEKLREQVQPKDVWTYLVHYPDYPETESNWRERLQNGAGICGTSLAFAQLSRAPLIRMTIPETALLAKKRALSYYQTQLAVMRGFMMKFVSNRQEIFFDYSDPAFMAVPNQYGFPLILKHRFQ